MPSLAESYQPMLEVLPESLGPALPPVCTSDTKINFVVLIGTLFSRMFASRQARETLDALERRKAHHSRGRWRVPSFPS